MRPLHQYSLILGILALGLILIGSPAQANEKVYEEVLNSVVWIKANLGNGRFSAGTGVVVDSKRKWVVTNAHVVRGATDVSVVFPVSREGQLVPERNFYLNQFSSLAISGKVLTSSETKDVAVIELVSLPKEVKAVKKSSSPVRPGQTLHLIGNPSKTGALWVYSFGKVRQTFQKSWQARTGDGHILMLNAKVVETQLPINLGDSGGPVVNDKSELVAIVSSYDKGKQLISTCIALTEIENLLSRAEKGEVVVQNNPSGILTPQTTQRYDSYYQPPSNVNPPVLPDPKSLQDNAENSQRQRK